MNQPFNVDLGRVDGWVSHFHIRIRLPPSLSIANSLAAESRQLSKSNQFLNGVEPRRTNLNYRLPVGKGEIVNVSSVR